MSYMYSLYRVVLAFILILINESTTSKINQICMNKSELQ